MLDVFFTVDVEIWCEGWTNLDEKFPAAFKTYIYGPTPKGNFGLPYISNVLKDHGLTGAFFVEALFSTRFGGQPLAKIVGLLHESSPGGATPYRILNGSTSRRRRSSMSSFSAGKRRHLRYFSMDDQAIPIAAGTRILEEAGATAITVPEQGVSRSMSIPPARLPPTESPSDTSYNACRLRFQQRRHAGHDSRGSLRMCRRLRISMMTVFADGTRSLRHEAQLTACSYGELERAALAGIGDRPKLIRHSVPLLRTPQLGPNST